MVRFERLTREGHSMHPHNAWVSAAWNVAIARRKARWRDGQASAIPRSDMDIDYLEL